MKFILLAVLFATAGSAADAPKAPVKPQLKTHNEPTNAAEAAAKKAAADKIIDEKYQAWKAQLPADQQAWETVLEQQHGIAIDDLHAFLAPQLEGIANPQDVHFNAQGYERMGRQVATVIAAVLH